MSLKVNLKHLENGPVELDDSIPAPELAPDFQDELVRLVHPVDYELKVERQSDGLLVTGRLATRLECDCARCLKTFILPLELPEFAALIPFEKVEGEEMTVIDGDFADLTPVLREDILLVLPTSPLCSLDCRGLKPKTEARDLHLGESSSASAWSALDKLKL
jgi:uncharacterized protein